VWPFAPCALGDLLDLPLWAVGAALLVCLEDEALEVAEAIEDQLADLAGVWDALLDGQCDPDDSLVRLRHG
jgi:hypothetical protein